MLRLPGNVEAKDCDIRRLAGRGFEGGSVEVAKEEFSEYEV